MSHVPTWAWLAAGWCAVVLGAWLVVLGRWRWRRLKGRLCARCGYDMSGLPSLTCPECGRAARDERELLKRRGRMRRRAVGVLLLAAGWLGMQVPAMIAHGWAAGLPSWALARWTPVTDELVAGETLGVNDNVFLGTSIWPSLRSPPALPTSDPTGLAMVKETFRRLRKGAMPEGDGALYLRRLTNFNARSLMADLRWPAEWPWDAQPTTGWRDGARSMPRANVNFEVLPLKGPSAMMQADVYVRTGGRRYTLGVADVPVKATKGRADFMDVCASPALSNRVWDAMNPRISITPNQAWVKIDHRREGPEWAGIPEYVCKRISVRLGGVEIGSGPCDIRMSPIFPGSVAYVIIAWSPGGRETALSNTDRVEVELVGDPQKAMDAWLASPTRDRSAWSGRVAGRVEVKVVPPDW